ncbi:MAG: flagellar biosynthetic protein FliR [Bdellovibrionales bacterium RBG_16_40_8]|nr:MAG: flagellar biosynthetic protein FliR [Bdellovibrionales bacterium RBG_16_40_8]
MYNFNMTEILAFTLVFLRLLGFVVTMPIVGTVNVSSSTKALLALIMTSIVFSQVGWNKITADIESMTIITLAVKEIFIGVSFGFLARLFFFAISMAGQIMSVSLGLSAAQLFNPTMGESATALDQFYVLLATLFFLAINGHHFLISGIFDSFQLIPLSKTSVSLLGFQDIGETAHKLMAFALKLSAPILVSILFMNVAIAVVGRTVPQINILITSLPINAMAGFFVLFISMPLLIWQMSDLLNLATAEMFKFLKSY